MGCLLFLCTLKEFADYYHNDSMKSQKTQYFMQVSDDKVEVSDEVYRIYLKAMMSNRKAMNTNGVGIATGIGTEVENSKPTGSGSMPVIYWQVDENNRLTGKYFTDIIYQPDGSRFFVGYAFKLESDMDRKGYHIDGFMIDQAAIEILDAPVALAASVPGEVVIGDEDVPLADPIPQTGDSAVPVLPIMFSGIAALGAAFGLGKKKEEK